jgi:hypothetical protein
MSMEKLEAWVRCLELAATVSARTGDHSPDGIVKIATHLYNSFETPSAGAEPADVADKPRRGRPPKNLGD